MTTEKTSNRRSRSQRRSAEYRFVIDAFTPDTIPMGRLAAYLADLATIMGEREHVHFERLDRGSAVVVSTVDWEAVPKVRARVHSVKLRDAPADVLKTADSLNRRLAEDNASAVLVDPQGTNVIRFPGRALEADPDYVFTQAGELYGTVIVIGGTSDPVPVHIQDEDRVHICEAPRPLAKELAQQIFTKTVAVSGFGRWARESDGSWKLRTFRIAQFRVLDDRPLHDVIADLRRVPADWKDAADPVGDLRKLRGRQ